MQTNNSVFVGLFLSLLTTSLFAANPASKEYVDQKAALLQAQIDHIQPAESIKIGDSYQGGIVFYLDNASRRGLIAATSDLPSNFSWASDTTPIPAARETAVFAGSSDTQAVISAGISGTFTTEAASAAAAFTTPSDPVGQGCPSTSGTCWHLPSLAELLLMWTYRATIGGFIDDVYWTSTESPFDTTSAYVVFFTSGGVTNTTKTSSGDLVRPIRAFTY